MNNLTPKMIAVLKTADSINCLYGDRGGNIYKALARRGITWPNANFLLTPKGIDLVQKLKMEGIL